MRAPRFAGPRRSPVSPAPKATPIYGQLQTLNVMSCVGSKLVQTKYSGIFLLFQFFAHIRLFLVLAYCFTKVKLYMRVVKKRTNNKTVSLIFKHHLFIFIIFIIFQVVTAGWTAD